MNDNVTRTDLKPEPLHENLDDFIAKELLVKSYDGTEVPLSVIHHKNIRMDGNNPCLLMGYGSYGISMTPYFSTTTMAWLETGGIYAVAHVRGGGEFGDEWHRAGQKATKSNTWKDFIACAEYLIQENYTSKEKIAGLGGSAGGITVGMAMIENPDLFTAMINQVGATNMIRILESPSGPANIPEFGNPADPEEFKSLLNMDTYYNIKNGIEYPAHLITGGLNDPRTIVWEPAKFAARLQTAQAGKKPILLRIDFESGHGIGDTKSQAFREYADIFTFLLWQFGEI